MLTQVLAGALPRVAARLSPGADACAHPLVTRGVLTGLLSCLPPCPGQGKEEVFHFLETVLLEVLALFPSPYIHIGGDEARRPPVHATMTLPPPAPAQAQAPAALRPALPSCAEAPGRRSTRCSTRSAGRVIKTALRPPGRRGRRRGAP